MKLSLAWLFSHIKKIDSKLNKNPLIPFAAECQSGSFFDRVGSTIAEIEHVEKITYPLDEIFFGYMSGPHTVYIQELNKEITLSARADIPLHGGCLVIRKHDTFSYLALSDLYAQKEGLVPCVWLADEHRNGSWKDSLLPWDYILTFDNKALTHRPDLWGHRGFAREIAALYDLDLISDDHTIAQKPIRSFVSQAPAVAGNSIALHNNDPYRCTRIAGLTLTSLNPGLGSFPDMVIRLCAIDAKPINALVDCTNYVMYDSGQPMHAFDADKISGGVITVQKGACGKSADVKILDGSVITVTDDDVVMADSAHVLSLAGVMGGARSAVSSTTERIFIEAAHYDASTIRKTSLRHKIRSESSTRFEKSLDPLQNTYALMRFLYLLDMHDVAYESAQAIISVGTVPEQKTIDFSQDFIQNRIGTQVSAEDIHAILQALGFGVQQKNIAKQTVFSVIVPTFRATKDITIPEDIVEEIARFIGFNNLPVQLPARVMKPFSLHNTMTRRALKRLCAYGFSMQEVSNYALYDNQFLHTMGLPCDSVYTVANPVSEHWTSLVASLIPHLLKNVEQNVHQHDHMAFFEMNGVWKGTESGVMQHEMFAALWYALGDLDFYVYKEKVNQMFKLLSCNVLWRKPLQPLPEWYHPYQTAELVYDGILIGYAGMVRPEYMRKLSSGSAFVCEYDYKRLIDRPQQIYSFKPISPYQPITTDMSVFIPFTVSIDALEHAIAQTDARIYHIQLIDYFEKDEWVDKRSATVRYSAVDDEKTFSKEEIEQLRGAVSAAVTLLGVIIR